MCEKNFGYIKYVISCQLTLYKLCWIQRTDYSVSNFSAEAFMNVFTKKSVSYTY